MNRPSSGTGGVIVAGNLHFRLHVVTIGKDKDQTLAYFVVTVHQERRADSDGFSFARRRTDGPDVLPVAATQKRRRTITF